MKYLSLIVLSLGACVTEPQEQLPESSAGALVHYTHMQLDRESSTLSLRLFRQYGGCEPLDASVHAKVDGIERTIDPGRYVEGPDEADFPYPDDDDFCVDPKMQWPAPAPGVNQTIEIWDDTTSVTLVVEEPSTQRTFELLEPSTTSVHPGDTIHVRATPAVSDAFWVQGVSFFVGEQQVKQFYLPEAPVRGELTFAIPDDVPTGEVRMRVSAMSRMRFLRCDLPEGCNAPTGIDSTFALTIVP